MWNFSMTGNLRCFKLYRTHVNYHTPKAKEGKVSDVSVQIDAKGKVTCILSYNSNPEITEITF